MMRALPFIALAALCSMPSSSVSGPLTDPARDRPRPSNSRLARYYGPDAMGLGEIVAKSQRNARRKRRGRR
jgi:hypothetical protein